MFFKISLVFSVSLSFLFNFLSLSLFFPYLPLFILSFSLSLSLSLYRTLSQSISLSLPFVLYLNLTLSRHYLISLSNLWSLLSRLSSDLLSMSHQSWNYLISVLLSAFVSAPKPQNEVYTLCLYCLSINVFKIDLLLGIRPENQNIDHILF